MELLDCLKTITDPRRPQGRLYPLAPLLFISVLAVLAGADSYRRIARFIDAHRLRLNDWLGLKWKRAPAHTAIRYAFINLSPEALEAAFRAHSAVLAEESDHPDDCIAVDGKVLKGSFDAMADRHAAQVLSAFTHAQQIILGHIPIKEKSNEIPAAQQLIEDLGLKGRVFTLDAEHCQKKLSRSPEAQATISSFKSKATSRSCCSKCRHLPVRLLRGVAIGSLIISASASSGVRCESSPLLPCLPNGTG